MTRTHESRLEELKKELKRELRPVTQPVKRAVAMVQRPSLPLSIVLGLGKLAMILALPFLVYVRSAVGLYSQGGVSPMLSVIGAGMITAALLTLYAAWLSRRFKGRKRVAGDYTRMALPVNQRTKHYAQGSGWVHAVDLRTNGRSEIRNRALQLYFSLIGFQTLRHVRTADHLHIQLAVRQ